MNCGSTVYVGIHHVLRALDLGRMVMVHEEGILGTHPRLAGRQHCIIHRLLRWQLARLIRTGRHAWHLRTFEHHNLTFVDLLAAGLHLRQIFIARHRVDEVLMTRTSAVVARN